MSVISVDNYKPTLIGYYYLGSPVTKRGISFTGIGGELTEVSFKLAQLAGTPLVSGTVACKIYAHSGIFGISSIPTGDPLETSETVLNAIRIPLVANEIMIFRFKFSGNTLLESTTHYIATLELTSSNANNYSILIDVGGGIAGHGGNPCYYLTSTSEWGASTDADIWFEVKGTPPALTDGVKYSIPPMDL